MPKSKGFKAFISAFAANYTTPVITGKQKEAFIAWDDPNARGLFPKWCLLQALILY
ncbi:MAG: hypothetical protein NVS1B13_08170 [Flavisolibacter sp.]